MLDEYSRGGLQDEPFDYQELADGKVMISWRGKPVCTLKAARAVKFLIKANAQNAEGRQLLMAKVTQNFKRGNER